MEAGKRGRRVEHTEDQEQLEFLCAWDEQVEYEKIRPLVLFGEPVPERSTRTGTSERTLYRRVAGFEEDGMRSLFGSPPTKRRVLPRSIRRLIVDLKAEHPQLNEIARGSLPLPGHGEGGDREAPTLAILHRDDLQHPDRRLRSSPRQQPSRGPGGAARHPGPPPSTSNGTSSGSDGSTFLSLTTTTAPPGSASFGTSSVASTL